jgi:hypothetical protein
MSPQDNDSPWEEVVGHYLPALLAPGGHREIDWSHDFEPAKTLDWAGREGELLAPPNPAALCVLAP